MLLVLLFCAGGASKAGAEETTTEPIGGTSSAPADQKALARQEFNAAIEALSRKSYQEGLLHFLRAQELAPHPVVLLDIARTYEQLKEPERALSHYFLYLSSEDTSPERRDLARRAVERIHAQLGGAELSTGQLEVSLHPASAILRVDGTSLGFGGRSLRLTSGLHQLEASAPGFQTEKKDVEIVAGLAENVELSLKPSVSLSEEPRKALSLPPPQPPPSEGSSDLPTGEATFERNRSNDLHSTGGPSGGARPRRTVALTLGGVGTGALASALGLLIWNEVRFQKWKANREAIAALPEDTVDLEKQKKASNERGESIQTVDKIIWATALSGGALLAVGITLLVWKPKKSALAWSGPGLIWTSRF